MSVYKINVIFEIDDNLKIIPDYNKNIPDYKQKAKHHQREDRGVKESTNMQITLSCHWESK